MQTVLGRVGSQEQWPKDVDALCVKGEWCRSNRLKMAIHRLQPWIIIGTSCSVNIAIPCHSALPSLWRERRATAPAINCQIQCASSLEPSGYWLYWTAVWLLSRPIRPNDLIVTQQNHRELSRRFRNGLCHLVNHMRVHCRHRSIDDLDLFIRQSTFSRVASRRSIHDCGAETPSQRSIQQIDAEIIGIGIRRNVL